MESFTAKEREDRKKLFAWTDAIIQDLRSLAQVVEDLDEKCPNMRPTWGIRPPPAGAKRLDQPEKQLRDHAEHLNDLSIGYDDDRVSKVDLKTALTKAEPEVQWAQRYIEAWLDNFKEGLSFAKKSYRQTKQRSKERRKKRKTKKK